MRNFLKNAVIIDGVLLILLGLVLVIYPQSTITFTIKWTGILLIVMGAAKLLITLFGRDDDDGSKTGELIISGLQVACGIFMLAAPKVVQTIIPFVAGLVIAYGAAISLHKALKLRKLNIPAVKPVITLSIITLVLALFVAVFMIASPTAAAGVIVRIIGLSMLLEGVTMLIAFSMRG